MKFDIDSTKPLATDGSDFHDSPIRDAREPCPVCKYSGPLQPHRTNPRGGWDRIDTFNERRRAFVVWTPPPPTDA